MTRFGACRSPQKSSSVPVGKHCSTVRVVPALNCGNVLPGHPRPGSLPYAVGMEHTRQFE